MLMMMMVIQSFLFCMNRALGTRKVFLFSGYVFSITVSLKYIKTLLLMFCFFFSSEATIRTNDKTIFTDIYTQFACVCVHAVHIKPINLCTLCAVIHSFYLGFFLLLHIFFVVHSEIIRVGEERVELLCNYSCVCMCCWARDADSFGDNNNERWRLLSLYSQQRKKDKKKP